MCKKAASKSKENGGSTNSYLGASNMKKNEENTKTKNKPLSPIKLTPTSVLDYFGTGSVQRSDKKMVASKRKQVSVLHASRNVQDLYLVTLILIREIRMLKIGQYILLMKIIFPVIMDKTYCHNLRG